MYRNKKDEKEFIDYYCFVGMKEGITPEKVASRIEAARKLNPENPMLWLPAQEAEAVDALFRKLSAGRIAPLLKKTPELALFDLPGVKHVNLCRNPGFEMKGKGKAPSGADWEKIDALHWSSWKGVYTPGRISVSSSAARSGKKGVLFEGCQAATVNYVIPVRPGERYRVTAWFKGKKGQISANFKGKDKKWLHKSSFIRSPETAGGGKFEKISFSFTVPPKAANCSLLFGCRDQKKGETLSLDDVEIIQFGKK